MSQRPRWTHMLGQGAAAVRSEAQMVVATEAVVVMAATRGVMTVAATERPGQRYLLAAH